MIARGVSVSIVTGKGKETYSETASSSSTYPRWTLDYCHPTTSALTWGDRCPSSCRRLRWRKGGVAEWACFLSTLEGGLWAGIVGWRRKVEVRGRRERGGIMARISRAAGMDIYTTLPTILVRVLSLPVTPITPLPSCPGDSLAHLTHPRLSVPLI